jgi:hypothetical protein
VNKLGLSDDDDTLHARQPPEQAQRHPLRGDGGHLADGAGDDPVTLREIGAELQAANDVDATGAAQAIRGAAQLPSGHLRAIASYAARAL